MKLKPNIHEHMCPRIMSIFLKPKIHSLMMCISMIILKSNILDAYKIDGQGWQQHPILWEEYQKLIRFRGHIESFMLMTKWFSLFSFQKSNHWNIDIKI